MRIGLLCASLLAGVNIVCAAPALAGASYKIAPQTRPIKYGGYAPGGLTDWGLAAGTLYNKTGSPSVYFSEGTFWSDDDFCAAMGASGGSEFSGMSRDSALTYTAGMCPAKGFGFVYNQTTNTTTKVDEPAASTTIVSGVADNGRVGGYYYAFDSSVHGFVLDGAAYTSFDPPGALGTQTRGISPAGIPYGTYPDAGGTFHGFLRNSNGSFTVIDVPGSISTVIEGLNSTNLAVGVYEDSAGTEHAFAWQNGQFLEPNLPTNTYSQAFAVSESGVVAGDYGIAPPENTGGFVWNVAKHKTIVVKAPKNTIGLGLFAINNTHAQVAGYYFNAKLQRVGFIATCAGTSCF